MSIDESARIHPEAEIDEGVTIGPWCWIGPGVQIGAATVLEPNVIIRANTRIGRNNHFYQFSSIGEDPADKKFEGEETWLEIGSDNIFREGVTAHRGTGVGGGVTRIGDDNLMMPYVHIAHDCQVGSHTVFANNVGISGHVLVDDWVILGGYAGVNQFLKIGAHAMIGGMTHVSNDVPAFMIVSGRPATVRSINAIGLERRGYGKDVIAEIREAFKILYKRNFSLQEAIDQIKVMSESCPQLEILVGSLESSEKGIHR
ncbi:MAG: acyl-ACP--UDP-N-acetylglucosamine O-acyltransferase [Pseudohongiellaceae bacterium]